MKKSSLTFRPTLRRSDHVPKSAAIQPDNTTTYWTVDNYRRSADVLRSLRSASLRPIVDWEVFSPIGPCLVFHVGCVIGDDLYIHGGVESEYSLVPSNKLFRMNLESRIWNEVKVTGSPSLSHHACIPFDKRYLLLIGGWDGRTRTSNVIAFDTMKQQWIQPKVSGFPEDAGLSSHTASLLSDGKILVLGREGTLRMQPKDKIAGNAYMLAGNIDDGFSFSEYSKNTESRSGHTTNFIGSKLYIIGGRNDNLLECHNGYKNGHTCGESEINGLVSVTKMLKPLDRMPRGRRHHIALECPGAILIHGGEKFEGPNRSPSGEILLMVDKPSVNFYELGQSSVGRFGHVCCMSDDLVLLHGGLGDKKVVYGDTRVLKIQC